MGKEISRGDKVVPNSIARKFLSAHAISYQSKVIDVGPGYVCLLPPAPDFGIGPNKVPTSWLDVVEEDDGVNLVLTEDQLYWIGVIFDRAAKAIEFDKSVETDAGINATRDHVIGIIGELLEKIEELKQGR